VSDLLISRDHLRRFRCAAAAICLQDVRVETFTDPGIAEGPSVDDGNEYVTIVRCRFSSISTEEDRARLRLGFKRSMPQQRRK